jgi:hypothetical protein
VLTLVPPLPPSLERIAATPFSASELPAGVSHVTVSRLPASARFHTLGGVRIDFGRLGTTESANYALLRTHAAAVRLAQAEAKITAGGLFRVRAVALGRFVVGVTARTPAEAGSLLDRAVAHFHRVEG